MKDLKNIKFWLFDLDNTLYDGATKVFDQVDKKMSKFISEKLNVSLEEARKIQKSYFQEYNTTLNGMIKHHKIDADEFLKFVHTINYDCLEKDIELREELLKLDVKAYCATNGSREHALNCMKKIGIDDLFEGKIMDIVDFNFKPKPSPESLKLLCDKFQIPINEETVYVEDICKNLTSETAKNMIKVWFSNDEPINNIDKYKDVVDYKIDNLALFLKKIRLLKDSKL